MGFILGLMGAGGAILTIPILVYLVGMDAQLAIACSLFIVSITSLTGGLRYIFHKQVHFKSILLFGIPSVIAVWIVRKFVLPIIPDLLIQGDSFSLSKSSILLFLFALIMMMASYKMIRPSKKIIDQDPDEKSHLQFILNGLLVGCITGFLGVGGGFLIVPALIIIQKLDFKIAAGTSLCIIAINSAIGFISNTDHLQQLDWDFLLIFTGIAIAGIFLGAYVSKFYSSQKLQPAFGYLLVAISLFILFEEIYSII
jgi:uncharacterized membrane protein YfcA